MTTEQLITLVKTTQDASGEAGRLFTITFTKANGELRRMRCRLGVQRNLKGKGLRYNPEASGKLVVWEAGNGYRTINFNTVQELLLPDGSKHLRGVAL